MAPKPLQMGLGSLQAHQIALRHGDVLPSRQDHGFLRRQVQRLPEELDNLHLLRPDAGDDQGSVLPDLVAGWCFEGRLFMFFQRGGSVVLEHFGPQFAGQADLTLEVVLRRRLVCAKVAQRGQYLGEVLQAGGDPLGVPTSGAMGRVVDGKVLCFFAEIDEERVVEAIQRDHVPPGLPGARRGADQILTGDAVAAEADLPAFPAFRPWVVAGQGHATRHDGLFDELADGGGHDRHGCFQR